MTKSEKLKMIERLSQKLDSIEYQDYSTICELSTDTRLVIRRFFGQESVQMNDFDQIRVKPLDVIANSQHYLMTGAWDDGVAMWKELLRSMHDELRLFNEPEPIIQKITISWLINHVPWSVWITSLGIVGSAFLLGVKLGNLPWLKQLTGE